MIPLVDEGKAVKVVYLDFSKAFDTVSYSILWEKLTAHGLYNTLHWIENWLDGRAQRVVASLQELQTLEETEKVWTKEDFPLVEEDQVREQLSKLDIHKSVGPDGMHPQVLRELAEVIVGPLNIIFERSWRKGEVPKDWRKANVTPVFKKGKKKDPGNYRPVSHISIPGKMMEPLVLGVISKHMEEKKAIRSSQYIFTKGKLCLTNLIAFYMA
ncbi:rna-directed dna polymerase from mobile element hypothetical protein [Limosa lapponica baueri]|uniref:Uncharacterized protein n=1 Tax=Limosa lapponica baueri TaxID=1758121 RepID=A0A2I0TZH5_LIMLA|nr:rna-directed dna polymerase from mobile element hypothetical protein [Limosa lapponica baueri]